MNNFKWIIKFGIMDGIYFRQNKWSQMKSQKQKSILDSMKLMWLYQRHSTNHFDTTRYGAARFQFKWSISIFKTFKT
jgi:hypothetical protein